MPNEPVQLVLNSERMRDKRETGTPNGNGKDFFATDNAGFSAHRKALVAAASAIRDALQLDDTYGGLGYVKVTMHEDAIAKSHRPQKVLFRSIWSPHVATDGVGEPIFAVTPESLTAVIAEMSKSEAVVTKQRVDPDTGVVALRPSRQRCEVSAIASITLWTETDRRNFSAVEASSWLAQPGTGGGYIVSCFPLASAAKNPKLAERTRAAASRLEELQAMPEVAARAIEGGSDRGRMYAIQMMDPRALEAGGTAEMLDDPTAHQVLLEELGRNPVVRSISLPPVIASQSTESRTLETEAPDDVLLAPEGTPPAQVGVIDGGVGDALLPWVENQWGLLAGQDKNTDHGTFISGLLVAEGTMNPALKLSPDLGCRIYDIDVLPADPGGTGKPFEAYYPQGVPQFLDEVDQAVESYSQDSGVRVFNLSINVDSPQGADSYGYMARRLDEMAEKYDVIFVISAGNLRPGYTRTEWHPKVDLALASLSADTRGILAEPGESLHNVSVSALNPPGLDGQVPYALARYSRRGPGLRGATKPDFAHVGGSGTPLTDGGHGLTSVNGAGFLVTDCGTSFAAPLVARRLADLDALIEGDVSRETLLALMVHFAHTPDVFAQKKMLPHTRDLIGFGVPTTAERMLQRSDSEITIVVSAVIRPDEDNWFTFSWPDALVTAEGGCAGEARLTIVAKPPIAHEHGDERVRANIHARLMQSDGAGGWSGQTKPVNALPPKGKMHPTERELLQESMKWQMVKSFETGRMRGRGSSSEWKLRIDYLERANEKLPVDGVDYSAVLTISDPKGQAPVFAQMRQHLNSIGVQTGDLRTSIRTRTTT
ncbi:MULTISPECIES: S8 family peptidase [unclassified Microbacterium]|uniref:S8 family peptidase n=1 Tax=unclassified Microbacterium TaxID=2609290 RepID=UPI0004939DE6|nr:MULTISPECIES: S8 family peptidase [unclassified Microbacterium]